MSKPININPQMPDKQVYGHQLILKMFFIPVSLGFLIKYTIKFFNILFTFFINLKKTIIYSLFFLNPLMLRTVTVMTKGVP